MATTYNFEEFHVTCPDDLKDFVLKIHESLQENGYKSKFESKASGYTASYSSPSTKRSIFNFFFRKNGLHSRHYVDDAHNYEGFLDTLPESMQKAISKSAVCKRMINPEECNPKCIMGYEFYLQGVNQQKCRYSCFQFPVDAESIPYIEEFLSQEISNRA